MNRFEGRTVIVTGAGSGIGKQMAAQFLEEGAHVFAADLDIANVPDGANGITCDVSVEKDVRDLVGAALAQTGSIDVMCNNAGIGSVTNALECTVEEWDRVFAVNARGVFLGTKHVLGPMLARGKGAIVNTASIAGMVGLRERASYSASKGAVIAFTRQVAVAYAGTGVRCNCICPGTVGTEWVGRLLEQADDPSSAHAALVARQPAGRLGTPDEIAKAALYLASDDAEFITGSALVIDGGLTAG
ncbi:MAG: SDR family NAD(P)-dependent oxidoreductase [Actinomycetota bacterium]